MNRTTKNTTKNRMAKAGTWAKMITLCMIMMVAVACADTTVSAKSKGYGFKYKGVTVYMGKSASKLIKKAGKPKAKQVSKSCAYDGKDRVYKYKNFILYTYSNSEKGKEYVNGITFLNSKVKTKEGIKIGSSLKKVKKAYGKKKAQYGIYTYKKGKCKLQIEVKEEKVTNIRYILA